MIDIFKSAEKFSKEYGDTYISVELLFLGLLSVESDCSQILQALGVHKEFFRNRLWEKRKGRTVNSNTADMNFDALKRYAHNLNEMARKGSIDPIIGRGVALGRPDMGRQDEWSGGKRCLFEEGTSIGHINEL